MKRVKRELSWGRGDGLSNVFTGRMGVLILKLDMTVIHTINSNIYQIYISCRHSQVKILVVSNGSERTSPPKTAQDMTVTSETAVIFDEKKRNSGKCRQSASVTAFHKRLDWCSSAQTHCWVLAALEEVGRMIKCHYGPTVSHGRTVVTF